LEEKHSAFKPYNRPVFEEMIRRIKSGEAVGIIAWHPDRLSRNEIDASTITYLVRTGVIHDLKFGSYNFDNSPEGIMMLQLALSQSQYFSSKLGKDVKRGLQKKIQMGWRPGQAPEGYLNIIGQQQGLKEIEIDKKRFALLRKAFDLMLTGAYTGMEVLSILNNKWGYKTRKRKKFGGKKLSKSAWYKILTSPFYAGIVVFNKMETGGKHKPLITVDEYNRIQELLGAKGAKRRPKERNFIYSGVFKCGHCDCSITAEQKNKYIKNESKVRSYNYYHCTHRKESSPCSEKSVEEKEIESEIVGKLSRLEMNPKFLEWALDYLDGKKNEEKEIDKEVDKNIREQNEELENQLSGLTMMRVKNLLDDEEYLKEKNKIKEDLKKLAAKQKKQPNKKNMIELAKECFIFSNHALKEFKNGGKEAKREILAKLGSNHTILSKKPNIFVHKWLLPIYNSAEKFNAEITRLEPTETLINTTQKEAFASLCLRWHGV
jgi:site-specific DNA recombinase